MRGPLPELYPSSRTALVPGASSGCMPVVPGWIIRLADTFWLTVDIGPGCWLWRGSASADGYGHFSNGFHVGAHRFAWMLANGPVPDGLEVCHTCDTPLCVRPDHLFVGTHSENMADAGAKGRIPAPIVRRGSKNGSAKLTEADVRAIRERYVPRVVTMQALADEYGVSIAVVHDVVKRRLWAHVA